MVSDPVRVPNPAGVNVTAMLQFVAGARLVPQLFVWLNSALVTIDVIARAALPVLYKVTLLGELLFPIAKDEKLTNAGLTLTIGLADKPTPVNETDCGLSLALSTT